MATETMSKSRTVNPASFNPSAVSSARRRAFLNGMLEGFSGPAMMGTRPAIPAPVVTEDGNRIIVTYSMDVPDHEIASLRHSLDNVAKALDRAIDVVVASKNLTRHQTVEKQLGRDGKLRDVKKIVMRAPNDAKSK